MNHLNQYFDRIFVINLARRQDRREHALAEAKKHDYTFEFFDGYDIKADGGGNFGANASHRGVLELVSHNKWKRVLVLEDDNEFVYADTQERFAEYIKEVPDDWEWLYLGGHYANDPKYRHSEHVMRINGMLTTSSYAVTCQTARTVAPWIGGGAGIDSQYMGFTEKMRSYIFCPRLSVQYPNHSNIQEREMDNSQCMLDTSHESRFPWEKTP